MNCYLIVILIISYNINHENRIQDGVLVWNYDVILIIIVILVFKYSIIHINTTLLL